MGPNSDKSLMENPDIYKEKKPTVSKTLIILGILALALIAYYLYSRHKVTQARKRKTTPLKHPKNNHPPEPTTFH